MESKELNVTAELAGLTISSEEAEQLQTEIERILDYFNLMQNFDSVTDSKPTPQEMQTVNRLRTDSEVPGESGPDRPDSLLDNAPEREDRFFVVPNVL
ncbi:MAG: Asp-tRNA(Asn)/Glu-tRNA(Gln) amidotransferase subunit GatC [Spirochaetales bacterium]|nr:Asp-tRNA(Asn)/Glu-tRNA(Gln) amidotransferase subunit GatC [Spirochaetales bacterium]MCF7937845.1 Asp-tRNA(Asn)/Glu-tRNA(Gln) amidotransferase subunit GatC [Spirochaetales bacterium]